jgi:hypothetical protein
MNATTTKISTNNTNITLAYRMVWYTILYYVLNEIIEW